MATIVNTPETHPTGIVIPHHVVEPISNSPDTPLQSSAPSSIRPILPIHPTTTLTPIISTASPTDTPNVRPTPSPSPIDSFTLDTSTTTDLLTIAAKNNSITSPTLSSLSASGSHHQGSHILSVVGPLIGVLVFIIFGASGLLILVKRRHRANDRRRDTAQFVPISASRFSFKRKNQKLGGIGDSPSSNQMQNPPSYPFHSTGQLEAMNTTHSMRSMERIRYPDLTGLPVAQLHMAQRNRSEPKAHALYPSDLQYPVSHFSYTGEELRKGF
ncbi:uncharacterized protein MELLADRAFT_63166 [Melampsora larici-populina 98AG31]|uniref:Uncharacterized protein n=1 Tax=Melampsora larici-populina (strain 98AG31 / pathotype 3-4-7) TaxID=747676 RepID=F4RLN5_MELLP|nr:uncharacterized protein MELLADRAFT_63166 [Melampsora larici-populina 98AG31]EGG06719.1 hypothetical protein MELLADRAFT_63166 [Melampsora larici-populina 98AG31]